MALKSLVRKAKAKVKTYRENAPLREQKREERAARREAMRIKREELAEKKARLKLAQLERERKISEARIRLIEARTERKRAKRKLSRTGVSAVLSEFAEKKARQVLRLDESPKKTATRRRKKTTATKRTTKRKTTKKR